MADLEAELARFETELARFEQPDPHGFRHPINGGNGVIPDAKVKLPPPRLPPPGQVSFELDVGFWCKHVCAG